MKDDTHLKDKGQVLDVPQVSINVCYNSRMPEHLQEQIVGKTPVVGRNTRSWMINQATARRRSAKARLLMPMLGMVCNSLS